MAASNTEFARPMGAEAGDTVPNLPAPRTFRARVAEALRRLSARTSPTAPASASASKGKLLSVGASEWLRDEALRARAERHKNPSPAIVALTAWQAIGIVFGDIGTSPLYTLQTVLQAHTSPPPSEDVIGATSVLVWTLTTVLVLKYALLVLRADDDGEGGTFALFSVLRRAGEPPGTDETAATLDSVSPPVAARADGSEGAQADVADDVRDDVRGLPVDRQVAVTDDGLRSSGASSVLASLTRRARRPQAAPQLWPASDLQPARAGPGAARTAGSGTHPAPDWRTRLITSPATQRVLRVAVVVAVGCILGDGVLTPSISVVSAVEGLGLPLPNRFAAGSAANVGLASAILAALFLGQRAGTGGVSLLFSPVSALYFAAIGALGTYAMAVRGVDGLRALAAVSPHYAFRHFVRNGYSSWVQLGSVALAITGAEALYADLGHFNRRAITIDTCFIVWPCLLLQYLGQTAVLLRTPSAWTDAATNPAGTGGPFWAAIPRPVYWPMLALTVLESIVASQALISASFSIVSQAVAAGFFPRLHIKHTSRSFVGQIFVPAINWTLLVLCVLVVCLFRTSTAIGDAYGIAVLAIMLLTTAMMTLLMVTVWRAPLPVAGAFFVVFSTIEGALWTSTLLKIPGRGWLAVVMALAWMAFMAVWLSGTAVRRRELHTTQLETLLIAADAGDGADPSTSMTVPVPPLRAAAAAHASNIRRTRGVALFYTEAVDGGAPPVLAHLLARLPVLYQVNIFLTVRYVPLPEVAPHERLLARDTETDGFYIVVARYGYLERPVHDAAFAASVVNHVVARLHDRLATAAATDPPLAAALGLSPSFAVELADWRAKRREGDATRAPPRLAGQLASDDAPGTPRNALRRALAAAPAVPDRCVAARSAMAQVRVLENARDNKACVFVIGRSEVHLPQGGSARTRLRRALLGIPFSAMVKFFNEDVATSYGVPRDQALAVVLPYDF